MKNKIYLILSVLYISLIFAGCGKEDPAREQFKSDFENFCINISTLDTSINSIDATADNAKEELLLYIDQLAVEFENLAELDFPEEFDYLEPLADEAYDYMAEAASAYHIAYGGETFAENYSNYAYENYTRAYRRVQIILTYLHGNEVEDSDLTAE